MAEEALEKLAAGFQKTESGLRYQIIQKGSGKQAEKGKKVSVHYQGALENGQVFDSSYKRKQPIDFTLGVGQVIEGWDEGIALLKENRIDEAIADFKLQTNWANINPGRTKEILEMIKTNNWPTFPC